MRRPTTVCRSEGGRAAVMPASHDLAQLLPPEFVRPEYAAGSLTNLPATVGSLLGAHGPWRSPALALNLPTDGVRHVVLLLVDGLGYLNLRRLMEKDDAGLAALLQRYGACDDGVPPPPITSVSPSTTTAATTALQSDGGAPGALGIVGFTQRMPSLGVVANMLFFRPDNDLRGRIGDLEGWGVTPEQVRGAPSIYQLLGQAGVTGYAFAPSNINRNPLSRLQFEGANVRGYVEWVDMLTQLGEHLERTAGERAFTYAYMPDFDSIMHRDGSTSPSVESLYRAMMPQLRLLLDSLSSDARRGTMVLVTADHGHMTTPPEHMSFMQDHPHLRGMLAATEGGEPRHAFLYAAAGALDELYGAVSEAFASDFVVLKGKEALAAGLYGDPGTLHPEVDRRVGDVVLLARGQATLWPQSDGSRPLGMHGSLTPEEMLVPLLPLRLDL